MAALAQIIPFNSLRRRAGGGRASNDALALAEAQLRWRTRDLNVVVDTEIVASETGNRFLAVEVGDGDRYAAYALVPSKGGLWSLIGPRGEGLGSADDPRDLVARFDRALRRWLRRRDMRAFDLPFEETVRWRRRLRAWSDARGADRDPDGGHRVVFGAGAAWALFLALDLSHIGGDPAPGASAFAWKNGTAPQKSEAEPPQFIWTKADVDGAEGGAPVRLTVLSDGPLRIVQLADADDQESSPIANGGADDRAAPPIVVDMDALSTPPSLVSFVALSGDAPRAVPLIRITPVSEMTVDDLALDPGQFQIAYEFLFPEPDLPIQTEFVDDLSGEFSGIQMFVDAIGNSGGDTQFADAARGSFSLEPNGEDAALTGATEATLLFDRNGGATLVFGGTAEEAIDFLMSTDDGDAEDTLVASADQERMATDATFAEWIGVG